MARRPVPAAAVVLALALVAPAGALAQTDPGDLGPATDPSADQYQESFTGERGKRRLPKAERRVLERAGPAGEALVTLVEGAPPAAGGAVGTNRATSAPAAPPIADRAPATPERSEPRETQEAAVGPVPLWLVVVGLGVLGLVAAVARWRRAA